MIREAHGNLLADDAEALVNTVNTVGVMGKGVALQFKRAYPEMFRDYERAAKAGRVHTGRMHVWTTGAMTVPRYVVNFPTKRHWRSPSRMEDIEAGLDDLVRVVTALELRSIALPPLGCGNGGLAWRDVAPRIRAAFESVGSDVEVRVYPPEGAPPAHEMVTRTNTPRLTPTRATLLAIMRTYQEATLAGPSMLETQKLAYLLQEAGQPLRLHYTKGHYGPYADDLRKTLRELEGHYVSGFGDGTVSALSADPLNVLPTQRGPLESALSSEPDTEARVRRVLDLIEGFDSAYGLELLTSVHWAAQREGAADPERSGEVVRSWSPRKAGLFSQEHIAAAWPALESHGWLREHARV